MRRYVLGGDLVGPSYVRVVMLYEEVETIPLFGSALLQFEHSAAYSPQQSEDTFRKYFAGGVVYFLLTVLLAAGVAVYSGWTKSFFEGLITILGVCFSTIAPLYEHIREKRIQDSSFGRDVLTSLLSEHLSCFSVRPVGWVDVAILRTSVACAVVMGMTVYLHHLRLLIDIVGASFSAYFTAMPLALVGDQFYICYEVKEEKGSSKQHGR
ncbi:hypothetical protein PR003_g17380 [Phytophthora rubi]|uniref:Uncharacterized protein n=1 Tax=Phytophthora rubi TaxID=129364 RepID=A0A6A4EFY4_9STRA|nr:hypothetical protein PR003_g17380 [Phytophthora rubi]